MARAAPKTPDAEGGHGEKASRHRGPSWTHLPDELGRGMQLRTVVPGVGFQPELTRRSTARSAIWPRRRVGWMPQERFAKRRTEVTTTRSTLNDAAELFIAGIDAGTILNRKGEPYKPSVRWAYTTDLRKFVLPDLGAARFADLRRADVQALVDRLLTSGQSPTHPRNRDAPTGDLPPPCPGERDRLAINPTANLRLPVADRTRERVASAARLLRRWRDVIGRCGRRLLRSAPWRTDRWSDIDLDANVIAVVRSWDDVEGEIAPKSEKGRRRVPISRTSIPARAQGADGAPRQRARIRIAGNAPVHIDERPEAEHTRRGLQPLSASSSLDAAPTSSRSGYTSADTPM